MKNILDNELVRTYFEPNGSKHKTEKCLCKQWYEFCAFHADIAVRVIKSMQEPIRKGERYLFIEPFDDVRERTWNVRDDLKDPIHPSFLRLPDQFQKGECVCKPCGACQCKCHYQPCNCGQFPHKDECVHNFQPPRDAVEKKIDEIANAFPGYYLTPSLRELVRLAREGR